MVEVEEERAQGEQVFLDFDMNLMPFYMQGLLARPLRSRLGKIDRAAAIRLPVLFAIIDEDLLARGNGLQREADDMQLRWIALRGIAVVNGL